MRPNAFTVSSRARSTSLRSVTSHAMAASLPGSQFRRGLLGERPVAVPDRDRGAGIEEPLDDRPPDPLRAAGDHREAAGEVDLVGHGVSPSESLERCTQTTRKASLIALTREAANCQGRAVLHGLEGAAEFI